MRRKPKIMSAIEWEWRNLGIPILKLDLSNGERLFLGKLGNFVLMRCAEVYLLFGELPGEVEEELSGICENFHKFHGYYRFQLKDMEVVEEILRKNLLDIETPDKMETLVGMIQSGYFETIEGGWTCR